MYCLVWSCIVLFPRCHFRSRLFRLPPHRGSGALAAPPRQRCSFEQDADASFEQDADGELVMNTWREQQGANASTSSHGRGAEISLTATVVAQVDRRIASMGWIEGSLGHVQCDGCSRVTKDRFAGKHPATKGDALHLPPIVSSPPAVAGRRRKSRSGLNTTTQRACSPKPLPLQ